MMKSEQMVKLKMKMGFLPRHLPWPACEEFHSSFNSAAAAFEVEDITALPEDLPTSISITLRPELPFKTAMH
ncbi:hypothetical protein TNCV_3120321 [Trichonephila clavipes]|uniref:Uncharacterized protein n=1 Tax=Trichonephila clavipes TaxID=2585209 RepID=A0A8X7BHT3_TRICX|nr:hypothetical protein TNCV_3120321 [Trichonephila clavipes]